jgi:hypothetical protein
MPILGQVALKSNSETGESAGVGTLHGVRRVPGGTVIYFSVGYPAATPGDSFLSGLDHLSPAFSRSNAVTAFAKNMLVDPAGRKAYTGLIPAGDTSWKKGLSDCICSDHFGLLDARPGEARVLYQVVAAVPASVQYVDVFISGQVIWHVKVDDGLMMPEVDPKKPILAGMGWPKVDMSVVASSVAPEASIVDLTNLSRRPGTDHNHACHSQTGQCRAGLGCPVRHRQGHPLAEGHGCASAGRCRREGRRWDGRPAGGRLHR